ncbi:putative repeat protein (TIGR01451 family) [Tahibacter aquaticus]|uniref:Putative repeat protein (TIGR01451 family) n=1 Tax=Tahibacter aquaticus TaxID=520092 RepID=A0A4R6Z6K6_9GAMM|nr:putative Ig domain-containing protein [Tahibacter aquaticus]TDR47387.1 putative repeat protein (TIGR01451 family) [Tahibacter aquaticus]
MQSFTRARRLLAGLSALLLYVGVAGAAPFAFVPKAGTTRIAKVDLATGTTVADIVLSGAPLASTVSRNGQRVYAVLQTAGKVAVIDTASGAIVTTVTVGTQPWSATLSPDDSRLYVMNVSSNTISVIDTASNSVVATWPVATQPQRLAVSPDGTRGYLTASPNTVQVIDLVSGSIVKSIVTGNLPNAIVLDAAGTRAYVAYAGDSTVRVIDTATNTVVGSVGLGSNKAPNGIVLSPNQQTLYVTQFLANQTVEIDVATLTAGTTYSVGARPYGIDITADGTRVYVANRDGNSLSVIDTATHAVAGTIDLGANAQPWAIGRFLQPPIVAAITSAPPSGGTWHMPYTFTVTTAGLPAPTVSVSSGALPNGLAIAAGGVISGTPTQIGTYTGVLQAVSGSTTVTQPFSIIIAPGWPAPPVIDNVVPGDGKVTIYFTPVTGDGNEVATMFNAFCGFAYSSATSPIVAQGLPNGQPVTCTMNAINSAGGGIASAPFATVTPGVAPAFAAFAPPRATWNTPYSYTVSATGSPAPVLSVADGTLPPGLAFDAASGTISGIPSAIGSATVHLTATNAIGSITSSDLTLVVDAVVPAAPASVVATPGDGQVSLAFAPPSHWGGESGGSYHASCSPGSGSASGTASPLTVAGLANGTAVVCVVSAVNSAGTGPSIAAASVTPGVAPAFAAFAPPRATWNTPYSYTVSASGSPAPLLSIADGDLPAGLAFDAATGTISGTPTAIGSATVHLSATNAIGSATSGDLTLVVDAAVPAAPASVVATPGNRQVSLAFAAPSHWGGETAGSYHATCSPGSGSATGATAPLSVTGLTNGVAVTCEVRAVNSAGSGPAATAAPVTPRAPVDLGVSVDNGTGFVAGGSTVTYQIAVGNDGPNPVSGAQLVDEPAGTLTSIAWTCTSSGGAACPAASGTGAIDATLDLPAGSSLQYTLSGSVPGLPETSLVYSVSVLAPNTAIDTDPANDSAVDGPDPVGVFSDGFD